ncbi:hypothetical protein ACOSQ4_014075 [Xanthoceras sorbifolium]
MPNIGYSTDKKTRNYLPNGFNFSSSISSYSLPFLLSSFSLYQVAIETSSFSKYVDGGVMVLYLHAMIVLFVWKERAQ